MPECGERGAKGAACPAVPASGGRAKCQPGVRGRAHNRPGQHDARRRSAASSGAHLSLGLTACQSRMRPRQKVHDWSWSGNRFSCGRRERGVGLQLCQQHVPVRCCLVALSIAFDAAFSRRQSSTARACPILLVALLPRHGTQHRVCVGRSPQRTPQALAQGSDRARRARTCSCR